MIIISRYEPNPDGVAIVVRELVKSMRAYGLSVRRVYLEDLEHMNVTIKNTYEKNIAYFLTNDFDVKKYYYTLENAGWTIINAGGLKKKYTKFAMQRALYKNNIKVPHSFVRRSQKKWKFPLYIKSHRQLSCVVRAENMQDITNAKKEFNFLKERYYYENAVNDQKMMLHKVYYVKGKVQFCGTYRIDDDVVSEISRILQLDIFSADIFIGHDGEYRVIDINPAPALYRSAKMRDTLAQYLCMI